MALFKIFKGLKANLPKSYVDGWCYVTTDDGKMYIDTKDGDATGRIVLNAGSADKLTVSAGSSTQPVYFKDGVPTKIGYTIQTSVPKNAVFTDTHNISTNIIGNSETAATDTTETLSNGNVYLNHVDGGAVTSTHQITGSGATTVTTDDKGNLIISSTNSNTRNTAGDYQSNNTQLYLVGTKTTDDTTKSSYATTYTNKDVYITSTNKLHAGAGFEGTADRSIADGVGNNIVDTYETKTDASSKLTSAQTYADTVSGQVKTDLLGGAEASHNTLSKLGALIVANDQAIDVLDTEKADNTITISGANGLTGGGNLTANRTISANLVSNTKLSNAATAATEKSGRVYPVALDKNGKLAVNVPWTDNNTQYSVATSATAGLVKSGGDITVATDGTVSVNDNSHGHIIDNIEGLQTNLDNLDTNKANKTTTISAGAGLVGGGDLSANRTLSLDVSGVTSGTYGPDSDTSGSNGISIQVPQITVDEYGRVTSISEKKYTSVDTDTHYTTKMFATSATGTANAATTNGNTNLRVFDNSTARATIGIKGTGATTVTSDANGVITINSTDNNTTYSAGTGITIDNSNKINHFNAIEAGSTIADEQTPAHGESFNIPKIDYDAQGHITGVSTATVTLPADKNTDTKVTQTVRTTNGEFPVLLRGTSAGTTTTTTTTTFGTKVTVNPSTGAVTAAGGFKGTADAAITDGLGNNIVNTYETKANAITGLSASGTTITYTKGDGTSDTITTKDTTYGAATASNAGLMSSADKAKLDGIATGANNFTYTLPKASSSTRGGVKTGYATSGKNYAVQLDANEKMYVNVPWTDNDTTYSAATASAAGLMSSADKAKLDGIATGANNYTYTLPVASSGTLGGVKTGYATSGKNYGVQLDSSNKMYVNVPWTDNNTTYSAATASKSGLMTSADKAKLDGIEAGATNFTYTLPTATSGTLGGVKIGYATSGKNYGVQLDEDSQMYVNVPWSDTTYSAASTSKAGLMSSADKAKLDGIAAGANNYTYTLPVASSSTLGGVKTGYATSGKNYGVQLDSNNKMYVNVPWTDNNTTYSAVTTSKNGLMTSGDKTKLDGISVGAQPNQNAFTNIVVGETTIGADVESDTITLVAGSNITLTPDATNDKITITAKDTTYSNFVKSGSGAKAGLVPAPSTTAGTTKYLREDGTWTQPPNDNTTYSAGTGISFDGTTINHFNAITAGTTTSAAQTPSHGNTFNIPVITYDSQGHITEVTTTTVKLPSDKNTDTKVTQNAKSDNVNYPLLGAYSSAPTSGTASTVVYDTGMHLNPSTNTITATNFAGTASKATADGLGDVITTKYETKTDAATKLEEAKTYADAAAQAVKDDLLDGAGDAYDTLKELAAEITANDQAIDVLTSTAANKADKSITITAGNGLTGGGTLEANRTIAVGAGTGITVAANSVSAALVSTTKLTNEATAATETSGRIYPVAVDKNGKLAVNVPWSNTTYSAGTGISLNGTTINHFNAIEAGTVGEAQTATHGGNIAIPSITYDAQGHITDVTTVNVTLPKDNNTDTKVKQGRTTTASWRPILSHLTYGEYGTDPSPDGVTGQVYYHESMAIQPSTGTIKANTFDGNALKDGLGNNIVNTYTPKANAIDTITGDGSSTTINYTKADGTSGTFKTKNTTYSAATTSKAGLMTSADKAKLDGIATGANNFTYTLPTASSSALGGVKVGYATSGKNYAVQLDSNSKMYVSVPWTDNNTTYSAATASSAGLMSSADKAKLDGIAAGANNFTYTLPTASSSTLGGVKIGYATSGKNYGVQLDSSNKMYVNVPWSNTTYSDASTSKAGLMSSADKAKLDGIAAGANNYTYTLPTASSSALGGVKTGYATSGKNYAVQLDSSNKMYVNVPWTDNNTTYSAATTSKAGLMTSADKAKLDGIAAGANNFTYTLPTASSSTLGGVKTGYATSGKNYGVQLDSSNKMYVNVPWANTTYSAATTSSAGLMSSADKTKLDGIATGANKYTLPTATSSTLGGVKIGTNISISSGVISVANASSSTKGVTIVYPADSCDSFSTDSGAVTPKAAKKAVTSFAITKANGGTFSNDETTQGAQPSLTWKTWGANNNTPYLGYASDQSDGTFLLSLQGTEYATGLAIGGGSGNLLWKGERVAVVGDLPAVGNGTITIKQAGTTKGTFTTNQNGNTTIELTDSNTTYSAATTSKAGLMSSADKAKLDGIAAGATNFTYTLPTASSSALGGVKTGYATSGKNYAVQLDSSNKMYVNVPWTDNNTTYSAVTTSKNGLMTSADKAKLDGIAAGATNFTYTLPAATASALGGVKTGYTTSGKNYAVQLDSSNNMYVNVPWSNTTYSAVTTSKNGLMTSGDKSKLDGIAAGANNYTLPVATSSVLGGVKSGGDISINSSGVMTVNDDSHNHIISNIDNLSTELAGKMPINPAYIELYGPSGGTNGGYIDFHYAASSADYTSRIIEGASGTLSVNGSTFTTSLATLPALALNGNITYTNGTYTDYPIIKFITGDANGAGIVIGGGGLAVFGSGESASALVSDASLAGSSETTYITSDNNIVFHPNCQTIGNRKTVTINTSGQLVMNAQIQSSHSVGGMWISGRDSATLRNTVSTSGSSFAPIISSKTQLGSWDVGPCHPMENFYFSYASDTNYNASSNSTVTKVYITNSGQIYGAVWNDYAEYRICNDDFNAGQVVCENNDDTLSISTTRLQPGACIVSDTFGFAIGETDEAKCPIAVSGRVLAYTYEPREEFNAGDAVCAGPNGTVSKMTREEIKEYPERIIGTVSAVPNYETWGQKEVPVDGRIWIKVV